jgi:hypothetical protein
VRHAEPTDLPFLAALDLEITEAILKRKIASKEIFVAHLMTLSVIENGQRPLSPATDDPRAPSVSGVKPLLQPTPTFQPSVNIDRLTSQSEHVNPPIPTTPSPVGLAATTWTPSNAGGSISEPMPGISAKSPPPMQPLPMPQEHAPKPSPSPTHSLSSSEPVGFLRMGYLYDSVPFLYSVSSSSSSAIPTNSTYTPTQILARLIDFWELEMKGSGFPFVLASVSPAEKENGNGQKESELEILLRKMNYRHAGNLVFPGGGKEVVLGKVLVDGEGEVMNPGALGY